MRTKLLKDLDFHKAPMKDFLTSDLFDGYDMAKYHDKLMDQKLSVEMMLNLSPTDLSVIGLPLGDAIRICAGARIVSTPTTQLEKTQACKRTRARRCSWYGYVQKANQRRVVGLRRTNRSTLRTYLPRGTLTLGQMARTPSLYHRMYKTLVGFASQHMSGRSITRPVSCSGGCFGISSHCSKHDVGTCVCVQYCGKDADSGKPEHGAASLASGLHTTGVHGQHQSVEATPKRSSPEHKVRSSRLALRRRFALRL